MTGSTGGGVAGEAGEVGLERAARRLGADLRGLRFELPVTHVYCPLEYAWEPHAAYLRRFGRGGKRVVFLGMNPGPYGMAQTGIPFGEVGAVSGWLGIGGAVGKPAREHSRRPVDGFGCVKSEVSGRRLWGLFRDRFGTAEAFFRDHFVLNYCPLVFMEESGRNRTPDKLPAAEAEPLREACDRHLRAALAELRPEWAVGVGGFAQRCLERIRGECEVPFRVAVVLHPSPASPAANRGWAERAAAQLEDQGVWPRVSPTRA